MNVLSKNKGVIVFYLLLIVGVYIQSWRIESLEERTPDFPSAIVINVK